MAQPLVWVPLHVTGQEGRKVVLVGTSQHRLSDKIVVRRTLEVTNLQKQPIGRLESISKEGRTLTVVFALTDGAVTPGDKFLLGLARRGAHVSVVLSAAMPHVGDISSRSYPGLLGEDL